MNKTKICFIHNRLVMGGAETALLDLCKLLDKTKYEITVFVCYPGGELEEEFVNAGINVENMYSNITGEKGNLLKRTLNYVNVRVIEHLFNNEGKYLIDYLYKNKFDLVVTYHVFYQLSKIGIVRHGKTLKYIHGNMLSNSSYYQDIISQIDILDKYDEILCVSKAAKDAFIKSTGVKKNIQVCYNPINSLLIREKSNELIDFSNNDDYIVAIGRLSNEKGFLRLVQIYTRLINEGITNRLLIIGDGLQKEELEKEIKKLGLEKSIFLLGEKKNPYPYIKNSKFLVISSYTEGMPVVAMESLCLGVPIVSSFSPIKELFGGLNCGLTTENDDKVCFWV